MYQRDKNGGKNSADEFFLRVALYDCIYRKQKDVFWRAL